MTDRYSPEKKKLFIEGTIKEYNDSCEIEDICKVKEVEDTDGSFIQIGIRPIVDEKLLLENKGGTYFEPQLPGIGRTVANGEKIFLITNILSNERIEKITLKGELEESLKYAFEFSKATILASPEILFKLEYILLEKRRISYENNKTLFCSRYPLSFVPKEIIGNKIVIIGEDAILWKKLKFEKEKLDIRIVPFREPNKVDITIRSINKIECMDPKLIKIIELKQEDGNKEESKLLGTKAN